MSCYALFQGWLLLSQPPGCLRDATTLPTEPALGGLSRRSGLLPSRRRRLAPAASLVRARAVGIHGLVGVGNPHRAPSPASALPPPDVRQTPGSRTASAHGCTSIHFGENQLSPGSIGISPLPTGHPPVLQHRWVRASTGSYPRFTLPMGSSPGFGSHRGNAPPHCGGGDLRPVQTPRFRCGSTPSARGLTSSRQGHALAAVPLPLRAAAMNSPDHSTKGTPSPPPAGCVLCTAVPRPRRRPK